MTSIPSPAVETYPSPAWFARVPAPSLVPAQPSLVVEHRTVGGGSIQQVHQQIFADHQLAAWTPDQALPKADLILIRPNHIDAGDLLGRLPATQVASATTIIVDRRRTSLFGIEPISRPGLNLHAVGTFDIGIDAFNTPFGDIQAAIRLNPDGTQMTIPSEQAESQIQITANWADFVEWICTDTRFGYLYGDKRMQTSGPLVLHSYIEGHISWPKAPQDQAWAAQFHKTMKSYQQLRLSSAYQELMDEIEEADTHLGLHRREQ